MQVSEMLLAEELDRLIHSAILRIEQQGIHVAESCACPSQMAQAQSTLAGMTHGLELLKSRRARFA